ncbi:MAG: hypothetical protein RDV41_15005 [Planctomycetota bacterium]|nr:hypothetical protein [Planctomycetota bacterium]
MRFANETGVEIFRLLVTRAASLGEQPFEGMLSALMGATAVCLANVLRPAVEAAPDRASAADKLIAICTKQARFFLESVVAGEGD